MFITSWWLGIFHSCPHHLVYGKIPNGLFPWCVEAVLFYKCGGGHSLSRWAITLGCYYTNNKVNIYLERAESLQVVLKSYLVTSN